MRRTDRRATLILMLKDPVPGRVKTRLGRDIGMVTAAWWFRHQSRRLIREVQDTRWQTILALAPDAAATDSRCWPALINRRPQGGGDLGDRMFRALRDAMPGPTLLIGGDIPGISRRTIADALKDLRGHDVVLGPAPDGGFWSVGLSGPTMPSGIFRNVRWSTRHALSDTLDSLTGHRIALTSSHGDIDSFDDLAPGAIHATPLRIRRPIGATR
ncbi:MAG: TIGR04282 family arsenosugar biosynthesis glycosyltransferase [Pseudomonadota bacterium]